MGRRTSHQSPAWTGTAHSARVVGVQARYMLEYGSAPCRLATPNDQVMFELFSMDEPRTMWIVLPAGPVTTFLLPRIPTGYKRRWGANNKGQNKENNFIREVNQLLHGEWAYETKGDRRRLHCSYSVSKAVPLTSDHSMVASRTIFTTLAKETAQSRMTMDIAVAAVTSVQTESARSIDYREKRSWRCCRLS